MATIMMMRVPGGTAMYDQVNEEMNTEGDLPSGMIHHYAAADGEDMIIFDVWESKEDFERFQGERLMPAVMKVMGDQMPPGGPPEPTFAELHNEFHK
jgi:heme-degrading monooxygenase HmoA